MQYENHIPLCNIIQDRSSPKIEPRFGKCRAPWLANAENFKF